jgi:3-hydroxybutyryl-CoA dehydrogenase
MDMETMDEVLENAGFRMGPFKLMDLIGNDVNLAVTRSLYEACGRPERFRPSPIQEDKVQKGELGRKTGKGYYNY